eukprot:g31802.t1
MNESIHNRLEAIAIGVPNRRMQKKEMQRTEGYESMGLRTQFARPVEGLPRRVAEGASSKTTATKSVRRSTGRNTSSFADRRALDASPRHGQRIALLRATAATVSVPKPSTPKKAEVIPLCGQGFRRWLAQSSWEQVGSANLEET